MTTFDRPVTNQELIEITDMSKSTFFRKKKEKIGDKSTNHGLLSPCEAHELLLLLGFEMNDALIARIKLVLGRRQRDSI
jgi:hypothetical protein